MLKKKLKAEFEKYGKMELVDFVKFLYQFSFGGEHIINDEKDSLNRLITEWNEIGKDDGKELVSEVGRGVSRLNLSAVKAIGLKAETVGRLFYLSSKEFEKDEKVFSEGIAALLSLIDDGALPFDKEKAKRELSDCLKGGISPVSHSASYKKAYDPHYRLISTKYVPLIELFAQIDNLDKTHKIIAIDGRCASGKTTLAKTLSKIYPSNVYHVDDFYLPRKKQTESRLEMIGGNIDFERFNDEIIKPLIVNGEIVYRPFSCKLQKIESETKMSKKPLSIVEGSYAALPCFSDYYDFLIVLDIDKETQKERIEERETPEMAKLFFTKWIPLEENYFSFKRYYN